MRRSISAQSWESMPPAPAWRLATASPSSYSPERRFASSTRSSSDSRAETFWPSSRESSGSLSEESSSSVRRMSSSRLTSRSWRPRSSFRRARCVVRRCPWEGSVHTPGSMSCRWSSPARSRLRSTSKVLLCALHPAGEVLDAIGVLAHVGSGGPLGRESVTLLVLLAGATRARRVPRNLVAHAHSRPARRATRPLVAMAHPYALWAGPGRFVLSYQLHTIDVADELLLDSVLHVLEHLKGFPLVLDQRIALPVRPQPDALLEIVHLVEVLSPGVVDDREQDDPLHLSQDRLPGGLVHAQLGLLGFVGLDRFVHHELLDFLGGGHLLELGAGELGRIDGAERRQKPVQVPFFGIDVLRHELGHRAGHDQLDVLQGLVLELAPFQDLAPFAVHDLALRVHDLVVLQHVLADLEVLLLHVLLIRLAGVADDPGLDGLVLRPAQAVHDPADPVRGEQAHKVVA